MTSAGARWRWPRSSASRSAPRHPRSRPWRPPGPAGIGPGGPRRAGRDGAREIDMVINIGALKSGMRDLVRADIAGVSDACHESGALNKVIIEAALLTDEEKVVACSLAREARGD